MMITGASSGGIRTISNLVTGATAADAPNAAVASPPASSVPSSPTNGAAAAVGVAVPAPVSRGDPGVARSAADDLLFSTGFRLNVEGCGWRRCEETG